MLIKIIAILLAFSCIFGIKVDAKHENLKFHSLTAKEVYRILKEDGSLHVVPKGRSVLQGIMAEINQPNMSDTHRKGRNFSRVPLPQICFSMRSLDGQNVKENTQSQGRQAAPTSTTGTVLPPSVPSTSTPLPSTTTCSFPPFPLTTTFPVPTTITTPTLFFGGREQTDNSTQKTRIELINNDEEKGRQNAAARAPAPPPPPPPPTPTLPGPPTTPIPSTPPSPPPPGPPGTSTTIPCPFPPPLPSPAPTTSASPPATSPTVTTIPPTPPNGGNIKCISLNKPVKR